MAIDKAGQRHGPMYGNRRGRPHPCVVSAWSTPLVIDLEASLLNSHSGKEDASPTWKKAFGFHPVCSFVDHGWSGTGEPLASLLRAGNAGSNTTDDISKSSKTPSSSCPRDTGRIGKS